MVYLETRVISYIIYVAKYIVPVLVILTKFGDIPHLLSAATVCSVELHRMSDTTDQKQDSFITQEAANPTRF